MSDNGEIRIELRNSLHLMASQHIPRDSKGLVIFAHGSGSSRLSPRNNFVADVLHQRNMATLLMDLLTPIEDGVYENRFNIDLLSDRLVAVTTWAMEQPSLQQLPVGYFGASTGAAAALQAAAELNTHIEAVVSRGGRPDLSKNLLGIRAPTLLVVGSLDTVVLELNKRVYDELSCEKKIEIVRGASHLFEEPGTLERMSDLAADWFEQHLIKHNIQPGNSL